MQPGMPHGQVGPGRRSLTDAMMTRRRLLHGQVPVTGGSASATSWLLPPARQSSLDVDVRIVAAGRGQAGRNPRVVLGDLVGAADVSHVDLARLAT